MCTDVGLLSHPFSLSTDTISISKKTDLEQNACRKISKSKTTPTDVQCHFSLELTGCREPVLKSEVTFKFHELTRHGFL